MAMARTSEVQRSGHAMWRLLEAIGGPSSRPEGEKTRVEDQENRTRAQGRAADKLRGFHDLAKDIIERGMDKERNGEEDEAIAYYRKAIECIQEGLDVVVQPCEPELAKKRKEMRTWKRAVQDRLVDVRGRGDHKYRSTPKRTGAGNWKANGEHPERNERAGGRERDASTSTAARSTIESSLLERKPDVRWEDISGLEEAKRSLMEAVILPVQRPELFRGLRAPTKGILLYGPPGTGKTLLAKAVAAQASASFFSVSSSILTSKFMGDSEKLVRELFECARDKQPSIIFFDEIDSILSQRSADEHEASRRLKSEFLVQFDGVNTSEGAVVCIGATNRPQDIDEAVRRRFSKRIYVPLPDPACRKDILTKLLRGQRVSISRFEMQKLLERTEGYSGADLKALAHEAAMFPIRRLGSRVATVRESEIPPIQYFDFTEALKIQKPTVRDVDLEGFRMWTEEFGMTG